MFIKGWDQLRKHVPDLNSPLGRIRFFLVPVIQLLLVSAFFNAIRFTWPFWQLVAEILLGSLGFGFLIVGR